MRYLERFNFFKKVDNHLTQNELNTIYDVVDMFADDNNLGKEVLWDEDKLKDITFYTIYTSKEDLENGVNCNKDINFKFFSNNLEFILIEDKYRNTDLIKRLNPLVNRIKRMFPDLKYDITDWQIKITKR
jgi:hypothetical protein